MLDDRIDRKKKLRPRDFNNYFIVVCPSPSDEGFVGLTADVKSTSIPRHMRGEFLNHSCEKANCVVRPEGEGPLPCLAVYTDGRPIAAGAQLTIQYKGTLPRPLGECRALVERLRGDGITAHVDECNCDQGRCGKGFVVLGEAVPQAVPQAVQAGRRPYQKRKRD